MFNTLIQYLGSFFTWIKDTIQTIWTKGSGWVVAGWAGLVAFFTVIYGLIQNSKEAYADLASKIADVTAPTLGVAPAEVVSWLNVGNTVFPLSETLGYIAAWLALYITVKLVSLGWSFLKGLFA